MRIAVISVIAASVTLFTATPGVRGQSVQQQLSKALLGTTITPAIDIAYAGEAGSSSYENNKPGKDPVKTLVYNSGEQKIITEKFGIRETLLTTHKSFPAGTQFTISKVEVHELDVQLFLTPVPQTGEDACVRLMMGEARLSEPVDQMIEDLNDILASRRPRKRDGKTDVEVDMNVLEPVGPASFTRGDVVVEAIPDTAPGLPPLEDHVEPYHPGIKEMFSISCGDSGTTTVSSNNRYFTKTSVPHKFAVSLDDVADGGLVIKITNNSSHSINGDTILLASKVNGVSLSLVTYADGVIEGSGMIPLPVKALKGTFFPNDSRSIRVYVQFPGKEDIARHSLDVVGTPVDLLVTDVPTKLDDAGNPTKRESFVFHFKVVNKHSTVRMRIPPPSVVCKTP